MSSSCSPGQRARRGLKSGFTLIELLVVIAIIAILASILFPVFSRARENARRASCQSNLKQIALGLIQYNQDYDGRYPTIVAGVGSTGVPYTTPYGWASSTQPYLKSTQILQCPTEITDPSNGADTANGFTDYYYNGNLNHLKESGLVAPTSTVLLGDGGNSAGGSDLTNAQYSSDGCAPQKADGTFVGCGTTIAAATLPDAPPTGTSDLAGSRRHLEGSDFAFADGHVKWFKGNPDGKSNLIGNSNVSAATLSGTPYGGTFDAK